MAKTYKIAALGGDGTGPEVLVEGIKVLEAVGPKFDVKFEFTLLLYQKKEIKISPTGLAPVERKKDGVNI